jgi:hypothetical protein
MRTMSSIPVRHSAAVHRPPQRAGLVPVAYVILVAGILALSTWQAHLSRRSPDAHWSVALVALTTIGAAILLGHGRQQDTARRWAAHNLLIVRKWKSLPRPAVVSTLVWSALLLGVVGWDLVSFIFQSHALPTLSYFIGRVTGDAPGRGLLFALWLGVGAYLASARRIGRPQ